MNGVTYRSVLVNVAINSENDGLLVGNATTAPGQNPDFQMVGYDASGVDREERRFNSFNYFARGDETSTLAASSSNQRWLAVVDGTTGVVLYNKVLPNQFAGEELTDNEIALIRAAVNQAELPLTVNDFEAWAEVEIADPQRRGSGDDADGDGIVNLLEYAYGSDPTVGDSQNGPRIVMEDGQPVLVFQRSVSAMVSPLTLLTGESPAASDPLDFSTIAEVGAEVDGVEVVRVPLPDGAASRRFVRLSTNAL